MPVAALNLKVNDKYGVLNNSGSSAQATNNTSNEKRPIMETGKSGFAFAKLWEEATKAMGHLRDAIIGVSANREQGDVDRIKARADSRAKMISAGKNTIPIAVVAIIAIIFLIVILNKK
jgi:hypothetical protein